MVTTIQLDEATKKKLDKLKIHYRETYNDLILRILNNCSPSDIDKESLVETIEIMSDPELMRNIADSMERINSGIYGKPLEQIEKELGLNKKIS